jgi:hypothetical protein
MSFGQNVIILNFRMLSVITLSVIWQKVIILHFGMLSVITHYAVLNNTECHNFDSE